MTIGQLSGTIAANSAHDGFVGAAAESSARAET